LECGVDGARFLIRPVMVVLVLDQAEWLDDAEEGLD
jgi:hypothetical protein